MLRVASKTCFGENASGNGSPGAFSPFPSRDSPKLSINSKRQADRTSNDFPDKIRPKIGPTALDSRHDTAQIPFLSSSRTARFGGKGAQEIKGVFYFSAQISLSSAVLEALCYKPKGHGFETR
jgi:hypothetical protein